MTNSIFQDARKKLKLLNKELNEFTENEEKLNLALREELQKHEELDSKLNKINVDINSLSAEEQKYRTLALLSNLLNIFQNGVNYWHLKLQSCFRNTGFD